MDKNVGSRAAVFHGNASQTAGGLRKKDLYKNKRGRIVSLKKSKTAKNWNPLKMLGLLSKSGEAFGARTMGRARKTTGRKGSQIKRVGKKYKGYFSRKQSRKHRGGYSNYPSAVPNFSNNAQMSPQTRALQAGAGRGGSALNSTSFNSAYPSQLSNNYHQNTPLSRALTAGA